MEIHEIECDFCGKRKSQNILVKHPLSNAVIARDEWRTILNNKECPNEHMCPECYEKLKEMRK